MARQRKARLMYEARRTPGAGVAEEIIGELKPEIEAFIQGIISSGQSLGKKLDVVEKRVRREVQGGKEMTRRDMENAVRPVVELMWGKDKATDVIVKMIAHGEYVW